jgi:RNA polymerase sigma factor (sigma-70 family)
VPHAASTVKRALAPSASPADLLGAIHRRHGRQLLGLALRLTDGHRADAEEILQGAYERAMLAPERYLADPEESFHRLVDALRDRVRVLRRRARREQPADLAGHAGTRQPHDELERAEERDLVLGALSEISPAERRTLVLIGAGYRQGEVARALRVSEACVAKTAERGRASLAERRQALLAGERCRRIERVAPAYLAGTLEPERRRAVERHLHTCRAGCPRRFARLRALAGESAVPEAA